MQSDHQGSYQRICVLIMRITSQSIDRNKNMAVEGHSRPQSPSFLGHVVGKRGRLQIKSSGSGDGNGRRRDCFSLLYFGNSQIINFMSLFRHSVWFSFSVKQFPSAEFGICSLRIRRRQQARNMQHIAPYS